MLYCEDCKIVFEDAKRCPACGTKKIFLPEPDDVCLLCEKEQIWGEVLAEVLGDNGIPHFRKNVNGAGMKLGALYEKELFYVNYGDLDRARELADELFSQNGSDTDGEDEDLE